nr:TRBV6.1 [Sphenodon punctatus]
MDWLAVIICLLQMGCSSAEVRQPWGLALMEGQNAHLKCTQNNGHNEMYWYRQKGGKELQLLFYFNNKVLINKGNITDRFTSDQPELDHSSLKISPAQPEDSAVYFCASSRAEYQHTLARNQTDCLESEDDISPPTVTIFDPSAQELQEKQKVTIVCLVTDFYPDHVNLTWSVDGDERTKGVKTKEPDLDEAAKKFSLISRLRITRKEWEKTKEIQCNVYFDPDKRNYTGTIRGQVCDGSDALKEPYLRSNNLGKLIYILLIFKSTLYGAFITGLMLRKKSMKEKPFA